MTRLVFGGDDVTTRGSSGTAILAATGQTARVYLDGAGTTLADISLTSGGGSIVGSTLTIDAFSRIPVFYGPPNGTDTLYVTVNSGPLTAIYARPTDRIDANAAAITAEATRATTAEGTNATAITAEATRATTAEATKIDTAGTGLVKSGTTIKRAPSTTGYANLAALPAAASSNAGLLVRTADGGVYESDGAAWQIVHDPSGTYASSSAVATPVAGSALQSTTFQSGKTYRVTSSATLTGSVVLTGLSNVTILVPADVALTQSSVSLPVFNLTNCTDVTIEGGRLIGPGTANALGPDSTPTAGTSYGVQVTNSPRTRVRWMEISGFYHGIRPDAASTDCQWIGNYIHDLVFVGIFPHTGDTIAFNRFENIGTNVHHHGLYWTEGSAGGSRCIGNRYKNISGPGNSMYNADADYTYGISCSGETFEDCGVAYDIGNAIGTRIEGATALRCTDRGVVIYANVTDCHIGITIRGTLGTYSDAEHPTSPGYSIDASGASAGARLTWDAEIIGGPSHGAFFSGEGHMGRVAVNGCTGDGARFSGATKCKMRVDARNCGGDGLRLSSAATRNIIDLTAHDNTGYGAEIFPAGVDNNTIYGEVHGNTAGPYVDSGAGNSIHQLRTDDTGVVTFRRGTINQASADANQAAVFKQFSGTQSGDLTRWTDSGGGTTLAAVSKDGRVRAGTGTAASPGLSFSGAQGAGVNFSGTGATQALIGAANGAQVFSASAASFQVPVGTVITTGRAATGSRPTASGVPIGSMFFDSTLNKPIWSDGTAWRDAAGTVV